MTMFGRFSCAATGTASHVSGPRIAAAKVGRVADARSIPVSFLTLLSVLELHVDDVRANRSLERGLVAFSLICVRARNRRSVPPSAVAPIEPSRVQPSRLYPGRIGL